MNMDASSDKDEIRTIKVQFRYASRDELNQDDHHPVSGKSKSYQA
jgi:hypothetical protein